MLAPVIAVPPPITSFHRNPDETIDVPAETTVDATAVPETVAYRLNVFDVPAGIS